MEQPEPKKKPHRRRRKRKLNVATVKDFFGSIPPRRRFKN